jgi:hypothetical protein
MLPARAIIMEHHGGLFDKEATEEEYSLQSLNPLKGTEWNCCASPAATPSAVELF